jgi:hypothetical protein
MDDDSNIWIAAGDGKLDEVRAFVEAGGVDPNAQDDTGYSALYVGCCTAGRAARDSVGN